MGKGLTAGEMRDARRKIAAADTEQLESLLRTLLGGLYARRGLKTYWVRDSTGVWSWVRTDSSADAWNLATKKFGKVEEVCVGGLKTCGRNRSAEC